ncbi:hypothetical protein COT83_05370 [Candidatus Peregrinibacteria bacterium CG10_big_fil_rev_8_21_14_0_10_44_7]|nr:MAG: hypothetical protein COT83_05370 [Candidatus Peregrinibacteria bacterium CG10_big_fil_rev_8_21_14_0_10_44_7]
MVKELFAKHASDIEVMDVDIKLDANATTIREKILSEDPSWEELVPPTVAEYLKEKHAASRLKDIRLPRK